MADSFESAEKSKPQMKEQLEYRGVQNANVRYVKLGSSNFMVSDLCMGTMTMGSFNNEKESMEILDRYVELGGNFIDTAEAYPVPINPDYMTRTEQILGKWLSSRPGMREKLFIATKHCGPTQDIARQKRLEYLGRTVDKRPAESFTLNEENLRLGVEASLARMKIDSIDLYQIHWPDRYTPLWGNARYRGELMTRHQHFQKVERVRMDMDEIVKILGTLIEEGKIRSWGVSNETTFGVCSWAEAAKRQGVPGPISIQNDFCMLDRRFETELAEACAPVNHDLGLLCYGALMGGFLTDKYCNGTAEKNARHVKHPKFQRRYTYNLPVVKKYQKIAKKYGLSLAQLAVVWCRTRFYMGSVIIGATSIAQLEENMKCSNITLSKECLDEIDEIHLEKQNPSVDIKFKEEATDSLSAAAKAAEEARKKAAAEKNES